PAATVYAYPSGLYDYREALPALAMVLVPAFLMVSTIRFRSFKSIDLQTRRPYSVLLVVAAAIMLITTHPRFVLVLLAYSYLASPFVGMAITRLRRRGARGLSGEAGPGEGREHPESRGPGTEDSPPRDGTARLGSGRL